MIMKIFYFFAVLFIFCTINSCRCDPYSEDDNQNKVQSDNIEKSKISLKSSALLIKR